MWIWLGICSMFLLGFYDLCKKHALCDNAVLPTLFFSNLCGMSLTVPVILLSAYAPQVLEPLGLVAEPLSLSEHLHLVTKAVIVGTSWVFAYFAMKHLPISIVSPIRASGPVFTLLGAVILYGEQPNTLQWVGMAIIFASYFAFSILGREEGIHFHRSKWIGCIFLATLIGTCSTLYDKWLIQHARLAPTQVLVWYSVYLGVFFAILLFLLWWPRRKAAGPFIWRKSIPFIGTLLVLSDFVYFRALVDPEALVVILSVLRRCSVLVAFVAGAILFKEVNKRKKGVVLIGILIGVILIVLSR